MIVSASWTRSSSPSSATASSCRRRAGGNGRAPARQRTGSLGHRVAGRWYVSILTRCKTKNPKPPAGVDLGVAMPVMLSDGRTFDVGPPTEQEQKALARRQRAAACKMKGLANRRKALRRVARLKAKLARRRLDRLHKVTTTLAKGHRLIAIEDLKVKNMTASARSTAEVPGSGVRQNAGLNRSILEAAPGLFRQLLKYKARWYGSTLVAVDPQHTSQTCYRCGHKAPENRESQALFSCEACGHVDNADLNAARNIRARGLGAPRTNRIGVSRRRRPLGRGTQTGEPSA